MIQRHMSITFGKFVESIEWSLPRKSVVGAFTCSTILKHKHLRGCCHRNPTRKRFKIATKRKISGNQRNQRSPFCLEESFIIELMDSVKEDGLYRYREVKLPSLIPSVSESELEPELERETRQRRKGRDIFLAVDQGPNSKYAFDWALIHLCRMVDTLHLVNAVSSIKNEVVHDANQGLMEKIAVEAYQVAMVKCVARIVEGDAGKVICQEAERIKPAAAVVGNHGRSLMQSVLKDSVSKYCFHRRKAAPVMVVPGKEAGDVSLITAKLEKRYKLEPKRSTISFMSSFLAGVLQVVLRFIQQKNNL